MHAPPPPGALAPEELPHQVALVAEKSAVARPDTHDHTSAARLAVGTPLGMKPPSQYTFGYVPSAHSRSVSMRCESSRYLQRRPYS